MPREDGEARSSRALPALAALPRDSTRRSSQLDNLLLGRVARFLETRSLQLDASEGRYLDDATTEGRGASVRGGLGGQPHFILFYNSLNFHGKTGIIEPALFPLSPFSLFLFGVVVSPYTFPTGEV